MVQIEEHHNCTVSFTNGDFWPLNSVVKIPLKPASGEWELAFTFGFPKFKTQCHIFCPEGVKTLNAVVKNRGYISETNHKPFLLAKVRSREVSAYSKHSWRRLLPPNFYTLIAFWKLNCSALNMSIFMSIISQMIFNCSWFGMSLYKDALKVAWHYRWRRTYS